MKKSTWFLLLFVFALAGLMAWRLAGNKQLGKLDAKKAPPPQVATAIPVNVDTVKIGNVAQQLLKTGTLIPWQEADIAATTSGTLQKVSFDLGSLVRQGSVVAQVESHALQLKLEAAQLQQQKLTSDYDRYKVLLEGEATTEINLQEIKFNLENANNQIAQIRQQIADNLIKSPQSGQIVLKNISSGEFVNPGTVLAKIVDISTLKVDVLVGEADAYKLKNGQKVNVSTEVYPGKTFTGTIIFH